MPKNKPKRKPKVKPAHTIAATAGVRRKDELRRLLIVQADKTDAAAERMLIKLRGDELARLDERVFRMETNHSKRVPAQEQASASMTAAIRARDVVVQTLIERVDSIERRISAMEAAFFDIAAMAMRATANLDSLVDAAPVQPTPEHAVDEPPSSCTPETNSIGTEGGS